MSDTSDHRPRERLRKLVVGEVALWGIAAGLFFSMAPLTPEQSSFVPAGIVVAAFVIWRIVRLVNLAHR
jgi:hypothetical protein